tara:strand:+ start:91 stop:327 length:237 start_codon:yes stop_codon:yes gene_type:complete
MQKRGELTFIPAGVTLIRFSEEGAVGDWKRIWNPVTVAVAGSFFGPNNTEYYSVIYEGQKWLARPTDCYEIATRYQDD